MTLPRWSWVVLVLVVSAGLTGCGAKVEEQGPAAEGMTETTGGHTHDGWWCGEHGVPEGICALCDTGLVAEFKEKGDWCREHERPDSQCFVCHPEREAVYAAQYEAKYGHPPEKGEHHEEHHEQHEEHREG